MQPSPASETSGKTAGIASWLLLFIGLAPWCILQWDAALDENASWLMIGARRLMQGGGMVDVFYDGDPPLNIFIYAPALMLSDILNVTPWHGLFLYLAGLTALAGVLVWRLASLLPGISAARRQVMTAAFIVGATVLYYLLWGEREQFLQLFLLPLALAQWLITLQVTIPRTTKYAALGLGALTVLIKPHFLLIPAVMLLHRAWRRKSLFRTLLDEDFAVIAAVALISTALSVVFYPEYYRDMTPFFYRYYILRMHYRQTIMAALPFAVGAGILMMTTALFDLKPEARRAIYFPVFLSLLSLVPCLIQMKGFPYHFVPAASFLILGAALFFTESAARFKITWAGAVPGVVAAIILAHGLTIFPKEYPRNGTYADLPFPRYVRERAANGAFYVYMDNMGMVPQTALYTGLTDASRFPSLWFLPLLLENGSKDVFDMASGYIAADFARWKPSVLMLQRKGYIHERDKTDFDYIAYFSRDSRMAAELARYRKTETRTFKTADYFGSIPYSMSETMTFDVYERKN